MKESDPLPSTYGSPADGEEVEYRHWNRIYMAVIIYTAALIVAIWIFSVTFTL